MDDPQHDNPSADNNLSAENIPSADLAAVLSGDLLCWSCKYDLTGLSVTGACPECGIPVRATLLAIVDPNASSFEPLKWPVLSALGLLMWSGAAFIAILVVAALRASDAVVSLLGVNTNFLQFGVLIPIFAGLSGLGTIAFIRPHKAIRTSTTICSTVAALLYAPLVYLLWNLHARFDVVHGSPYFGDSLAVRERVEKRILIGLLILCIALLLRPAVRGFAARSVLMRTGQLTRQTLLAFAAAVVISLLGDILHYLSLQWPALESVALTTIWMAFVVIGSAMIAVGFGGMFWDSIRLYPVIRRKPRSLGEVIRKESLSGSPETQSQ